MTKNSAENSSLNSTNLTKNSKNFTPNSIKNLLKSQRKISQKALIKAYFTLFKEFKRLYFGSNFKLKFYEIYAKIADFIATNLSKNPNKIQISNDKKRLKKWQTKHAQRKQNLAFAKQNLKQSKKRVRFLKQILPESEIWLNSSEFKEKYLDTKHPFAPLLNPAKIDYTAISAEFAWDLNLPLPKNYDFIWFSNGSSATAATFCFLQECNVKFRDFYKAKDIYLYYFDLLNSQDTSKKCFFSFISYVHPNLSYYSNPQENLHLASSLSKVVPLLYISRDPIEKIQHGINHILNEQIVCIRECNLTYAYSTLLPKLIFHGGDKPSFKMLENYEWIRAYVVLDSLLKAFKKQISFIHCVDFNDLKPEFAFETYCKIADKFGFARPKNAALFTNRINRNRGTLTALPITLYAHESDLKNCYFDADFEQDLNPNLKQNLSQNLEQNSTNSKLNLSKNRPNSKQKQDLASLKKDGGFSFIITLPHYIDEKQRDFIDITDEIEANLRLDDTQILIIIDKNELIKIRQNTPLYKASINYLKGYIKALRAETCRIKNSLISEEQILNFFAQNEKPRKLVKALLDSELSYIKQNHPEFLKKWKYYNKFEQICAKFDGKEAK